MSYIRYFMPMISEAKNYGYKNRQPAGRSLVEGRNQNYKLTIWAQDLKPQTLYSVFLLFPDDKRYAGVLLSSLPVDDRGKGEIRKEFDNTVLGKFALEDLIAVAVIAKDNHGVSSPLCGYKDDPISWRHGFYEYELPVEPKAENVLEAPREAAMPEPNERVLPPLPAVEEAPTLEEASTPEEAPTLEEPSIIEAAPETDIPLAVEETPPGPIIDELTMEKIEISSSHDALPQEEPVIPGSNNESYIIPAPEDTVPDFQEKPNTTWNLPQSEMANAFRKALDQLHTDTMENAADCDPKPSIMALFETREHITPFQKQARKATWISFTPSDPIPPPANKPGLYDDPFIQAALAEYMHLILGLTTDQGPRRYIIGVPGVYSQEAKVKAKRLGFTQFKCTRDSLPAWGEAGYWLMFTTVC